MARSAWVVAAFTAAGCAADPSWKMPASWTIDGSPPAGLDEALAVLRETAKADFDIDLTGGHITFVEGPFRCGEVLAAGCWFGVYDHSPTFTVSTDLWVERTALAHEVGHYLWTRAGFPMDAQESESAWTPLGPANPALPEKVAATPEFAAWIAKVNLAIAARLGR